MWRSWVGKLLLCAVVTLLPACSGVTPIKVQDQPSRNSPPDPGLFQPGDIVLTITNDPSSWLLALLANPEPDGVRQAYTHGEMVFIDRDGTKMLGGFSGRVMSEPLVDRLPLFDKLVVLRPRQPTASRYRLAAQMAKMTHTSKLLSARFDYSFRDVPGRTDRFYCLGLINEAYRRAQVPVPFPHKPVQKNQLIRHVEMLVGHELDDGPIVQDVVANPDFEVVLEWSSHRHGGSDAWFNQHIARYTLDVYEDGWQLKPSDEIAVSMLLWLVDDGSFDELKKTLRTFENFSSEVAMDWYRFQLEDEFESLDEPSKIRALQRLAAHYRDEYFVRSNQQGVSVASE